MVRSGGSFARYGLYHGIIKMAAERAFGPMKPLPATLVPAFMTSMILERHYGPEYAFKSSLVSSISSIFMEKGTSMMRKTERSLFSTSNKESF